jgi:DNA-binding response OmpR family regulator
LANGQFEVLVVDDDRKTVDLVRMYLEHGGYTVRVAYDGRQALQLAHEHRPDLVVLDLMLPHLDGLDVCHALREEVGPLPVIMLTARTTEADKLAGLETGADDYVTKPFSPRELVARVKAVLRRSTADATQSRSVFGDLVIDHRMKEARVGNINAHLTPREFKLLETLAREPDRPFSRQGLVDRAFGLDYEGLERTVDAHVANLRRKIEPNPGRPIYVLTVAGVGYKLTSFTKPGEGVSETDAPPATRAS